VIGVIFVFAALLLLSEGALRTGTLADASYYLVLFLFVAMALALFVAAFQFPYAVEVSNEGLGLRYIHRKEMVPAARISMIEARGGFVGRSCWIVFANGEAKPIGIRNRRLPERWRRFHAHAATHDANKDRSRY